MKLRLLFVTALVSILTACSTGRGIPAPVESRDGGEVIRTSRSNAAQNRDGRQQGTQQGRVMPQGAQPNVYPAQSRTVITGPRPTTGQIPSAGSGSESGSGSEPIYDSVPEPVPDRAPGAIITPAPQLPTQTPDRTNVPASGQPSRQPAIAIPTAPVLPPSRSRPSAASAPAMALLESAESAIAAGDLERAAALCERALRITPRDGYLWYRLASIHYQQQNYDDATGFARRALSFAGSNQALTQDINILLESADTARDRAQ